MNGAQEEHGGRGRLAVHAQTEPHHGLEQDEGPGDEAGGGGEDGVQGGGAQGGGAQGDGGRHGAQAQLYEEGCDAKPPDEVLIHGEQGQRAVHAQTELHHELQNGEQDGGVADSGAREGGAQECKAQDDAMGEDSVAKDGDAREQDREQGVGTWDEDEGYEAPGERCALWDRHGEEQDEEQDGGDQDEDQDGADLDEEQDGGDRDEEQDDGDLDEAQPNDEDQDGCLDD